MDIIGFEDNPLPIFQHSNIPIDGKPLKRQPEPGLFRALRELSPFVLIRADRYFAPRRAADDPRTTPPARRRRQPELEIEREISRVYNELIASDGPAPPESLLVELDQLRLAALSEDEQAVRQLLSQLVGDYKPILSLESDDSWVTPTAVM